MEALCNVIAALGLVGSVALIAWGMVLCVRHGLGSGAAGPSGRSSPRAAMGA